MVSRDTRDLCGLLTRVKRWRFRGALSGRHETNCRVSRRRHRASCTIAYDRSQFSTAASCNDIKQMHTVVKFCIVRSLAIPPPAPLTYQGGAPLQFPDFAGALLTSVRKAIGYDSVMMRAVSATATN